MAFRCESFWIGVLLMNQVGLLLNTIRGKKVSILVGIGVQKYSFLDTVFYVLSMLLARCWGFLAKRDVELGTLSSSGHGFLSPFKVEAKKEPLATARFDHYDMSVYPRSKSPQSVYPLRSRVEKGLSQSQCIVYFGL